MLLVASSVLQASGSFQHFAPQSPGAGVLDIVTHGPPCSLAKPQILLRVEEGMGQRTRSY
jgi:hypothetical protein